MNKITRFVLGTSIAVGCACALAAQDKPAAVPNVLQVTREFVKPGRAGAAHEKTEAVFVQAMRKANWPTNYIGMTSLSGKSRALFLTFYGSFDAWEKDTAAMAKTSLASAVDQAYMADGDLLDGLDQAVFYYNDEMSLRPKTDLQPMRFFEFTTFHVKPGKDSQWREVVKMAKGGYEKALPEAHWGMFSLVYGAEGGTYLLIVGHKSLSEVDKGFAEGKQFETAMGEEGMKKLDALFAECVDGVSSSLFAVNPNMSYVKDEWIKADPSFWQPKSSSASAVGPAEAQQGQR
jgi:hypothetical protein